MSNRLKRSTINAWLHYKGPARARRALPRLMTYREFWPRYLAAHADRRCRALHYVGTLAAAAAIAAAAELRDWRWLLAAPILGYGPAWFAHFRFEHNRPETFAHPLWSLASDIRMLWLSMTGRLAREMRRAGVAR